LVRSVDMVMYVCGLIGILKYLSKIIKRG
jgi:hypothetical protein